MEHWMKLLFVVVSLVVCSASQSADLPPNSIQWRDEHLKYVGVVTAHGTGIYIVANVFNLSDDKFLFKPEPFWISPWKASDSEVVVDFQVNVSGDAAQNNSSHAHVISLIFQFQRDGTFRLTQNCFSDTQCWTADGIVAGQTATSLVQLPTPAQRDQISNETLRASEAETQRALESYRSS